MPNPYHIFTLKDVFYRKFPEKSMRKLLDSCSDGMSNLSTQVTLGDVALNNSVLEAWWCVRVLPGSAKNDVLKAALPCVKRAFQDPRIIEDLKKNDFSDSRDSKEWIQSAIDLLESTINNRRDPMLTFPYVFAANVRRKTIGDVVYYLLQALNSDGDYTDSIIMAMSVLDSVRSLTVQESDQQVNDICAIFPPIVGVKYPSH